MKTGKSVLPLGLGALDLGVPIGALDQPDHQPPTRAAREIDEPVDHEDTALAVGLDHEAEPVPVREIRVEAQRLEEVERQIEAVGFLGVDVEADVVGFRQRSERLDARQEFVHHARPLDSL